MQTDDTAPAFAVLNGGPPPARRAAALPLDALSWPLGRPARLARGTISDLGPQDHLITYPRTRLHFAPKRWTQARVSLILGEPSYIHAKHLALLRLTWRRFYRILTFNERLLARIPNGIFFPLGGTWVPDWQSLPDGKTGMVSLIASAKRDTEGHRLRHAIVDWARAGGAPVDVMGRGYSPFERKSDGLAPYRYSVVIENGREPNYFSEKLLDAVLCRTVPIYWGCPNLERFFDTTPIVQCASEADLRRAVRAASEDDYAARRPALDKLRGPISAYADIDRRAAEAVRDSLRSA